MTIKRHMDLYVSLREGGKPAIDAVAATQYMLGELPDLEYSEFILAIATYEIGKLGADPNLAPRYSKRMRASSARTSNRIRRSASP